MPVYEYQCTKCGEVEEAFQKISDAPLSTCSHCEGKLKKLISQSTFHLKGSGWYVTDYGGSKSGASGTEKSEKKAGSSKTESSKVNKKKPTEPKAK